MTDPLVRLVEAMARGEVGVELSTARPPQTGRRRSAVMILFVGESIVFVERAATLRKHAGQVAFPGGGLDAGETAVEAALRETWEETGLDPTQIRVLGALPATNIPVSGYDVIPVLGWWRGDSFAPAGWDEAEVAGVHAIAIDDLVNPAHRFTAVNRRGFTTPGFDVAPLWIWGFTAFVLDAVLEAGGWAVPWNHDDQRPVPTRYGG